MSDLREPHLHIDAHPGLHAALLDLAAASKNERRAPRPHRAHPRKRAQRRQVRASRKANR